MLSTSFTTSSSSPSSPVVPDLDGGICFESPATTTALPRPMAPTALAVVVWEASSKTTRSNVHLSGSRYRATLPGLASTHGMSAPITALWSQSSLRIDGTVLFRFQSSARRSALVSGRILISSSLAGSRFGRSLRSFSMHSANLSTIELWRAPRNCRSVSSAISRSSRQARAIKKGAQPASPSRLMPLSRTAFASDLSPSPRRNWSSERNRAQEPSLRNWHFSSSSHLGRHSSTRDSRVEEPHQRARLSSSAFSAVESFSQPVWNAFSALRASGVCCRSASASARVSESSRTCSAFQRSHAASEYARPKMPSTILVCSKASTSSSARGVSEPPALATSAKLVRPLSALKASFKPFRHCLTRPPSSTDPGSVRREKPQGHPLIVSNPESRASDTRVVQWFSTSSRRQRAGPDRGPLPTRSTIMDGSSSSSGGSTSGDQRRHA
mmetsp:Transcript_49430/g.163737  ORF Transcript_49430/g.163737 Transcript_49430/m.163737 type:complete len:441 (-) Transcript_49430:1303-2625(-)